MVTVQVSTHSRLKAAGPQLQRLLFAYTSFNTQPPEGGWLCWRHFWLRRRGFNTQPPEGGWRRILVRLTVESGFNTQPPEGGWSDKGTRYGDKLPFQHTAA